ncbi:response regulator [Mastigocoleus testarum]|uniref:Transcriptional regulator n=1 Tax=Mastigocoleus testarum BC008 TaxID=371196 RepID=A0A0V7ZBL7_9CYAN|nr:response regulator [Mastigocoleus testarum]KST61905.1 transcriptional regulator [Mastigocoleus testarum BC008]
MRILVVDDDRTLVDVLKKSLAELNYAIDAVTDGEQGWIYGSTYTYDLIILDWSLPRLDGISLCERFRENGYHMPILLLTSRNGSQAKIQGLDAGADDYLGKPFDIDELAARIRALLRRVNSNSRPVLSWGNLQLDPCSGEVNYQGQLLFLTGKEYGLLELFLRHSQKIFSIEEIIQSLWSSVEYPAHATVRSHLRRLRNQLKLAGLPEDPIETVRGRGYCLKNAPQVNNPQNRIKSNVAKDSKNDKKSLHLTALNSVWEKHRQRNKQQLLILESAIKALKEENLNQSDRQEAKLIAHNLAGNLGIFGFDTESELAKELEQLLETNISQDSLELQQVESIFNTLNQNLFGEEEPENNLSDQVSSQLGQHSPLLLIVDDDTKFTEQLTQEATTQGIRTAIATTPDSARSWLDGEEHQEFPDVVIIKVSFARSAFDPTLRSKYLSLIAEFNLLTPSIPVLAIADSDRVEDRLHVARHGSSFYLKQPITPIQVIDFCKQVIERSRDKRIMVVDDDSDLLRLLPSLLEPWKFQLTTLDDPRQFWEVLQVINPHLLVLDIEMPHISGIELCQVLRNHSYWCKLPVLFLSIHQDVALREQALTSGADDFVNKPVIAKQLAVRIINCLERRA